MRCSQLETRLNDLLDRREDPRRDPEIAAHSADCPRCRRLTAAYVGVARGAEELGRTTTAAAPTPIGLRGAAGAVLAVAAALLIYVTGESAPPPVAVPATSTIVAKPAPVVAEMVRDAGRAYAAFVHGTARSVDEAFVLASSLPAPQEMLDPVLFPEDGLWRRFGTEWAPVAGETFDALGRVFTDDATL